MLKEANLCASQIREASHMVNTWGFSTKVRERLVYLIEYDRESGKFLVHAPTDSSNVGEGDTLFEAIEGLENKQMKAAETRKIAVDVI
jgi:hypothetical protein